LPLISAEIILITSLITIIFNALVIIAVKQRKELQKHSNIVLSSIAIVDLLVGAIAMPMIATVDLLIVHELSFEHVHTLDPVSLDLMLNALPFLPPHRGCLEEVCSDTKMDGLQVLRQPP